MRRFDIWDVLFWFFMLLLVGYIIAKLLGWINTPDWINLLPLVSVVFLVGISYQRVMSFMDRMLVRTDYFKNNLVKINERLDNYDNRFIEYDKRLFALEDKVDMLIGTKRK